MQGGKRASSAASAGLRATESRTLDFYHSDRSLKALLGWYLPAAELAHLEPHLARLGRLVGGRLDELAREADRTPPRLEARNRLGEDRPSMAGQDPCRRSASTR
jgi:acyl-CoA dehydrogenase